MNRVLVSLICFIVLALAGCGQQNQGTSNLPPSTYRENEFPDFLVGVWKADYRYNWAFKFERDGTILRLEHVVAGPVKTEEGGIYVEGPDEGTFAYFVVRPSRAVYNPANRQLTVKIVLDEFHMRLPLGDLEGRSEDYFEGPVSDDGKTWTAYWRSYGSLKGSDPPDANLIEANPEKLIFTKMDLSDINDVNSVG